MPSFLVRCLLFLSSYAPLMAIFTLRTFDKIRWWSLLFSGLGLLSLFALWFFLRQARRLATTRITADAVILKDAEAMSYIVTYVIPFIDLPFDDWRNAVSLCIFFIMLGFIYINSNMIHINPILNACGFHLLEVETGGVVHSMITKKRHIAKGVEVMVHRLGHDVMLEAR